MAYIYSSCYKRDKLEVHSTEFCIYIEDSFHSLMHNVVWTEMWVEYCDHELFYDIRLLLKVFGSLEEYFHLLSYTNKFFRHKENVSFFEGGGWWTMKFKPPSVLLMPPALVLSNNLQQSNRKRMNGIFMQIWVMDCNLLETMRFWAFKWISKAWYQCVV